MALGLGSGAVVDDLTEDWRRFSPFELVSGGKWRKAMFFTYALSLGFFESVLLPHLRRGGLKEASIFADVRGVADALSESGAREVGRSYVVHPVRLERGIFHPKLAVLEGDDLHLLAGSGNMTFGGWGANLEAVEHLTPAYHPAAFADAAAFLEALATSPDVALAEPDVIEPWITMLGRAGAGATEGAVRLLHNLDRSFADQLIAYADGLGGAKAMTIASPYYGGPAAVASLVDRLGISDVSVHVPLAFARNGEVFPFERMPMARAVVLDVLEPEAGKRGRPEHVKLIEIECVQGRMILTGSVNATPPALGLGARRNVELGVLRLFPDGLRRISRRPYQGSLPVAELASAIEADGHRQDVLYVRVQKDALIGVLLSGDPAGQWDARLDSNAARRELGPAEVNADGSFTVHAPGVDDLVYRSGRAVLTLERPGRRARGFLTFTDLIVLGGRLGSSVGPLLRFTSGTGDEDDLTALLEWFAMHPEDTLSAWRGPSKRHQAINEGPVFVPIGDLDIRRDPVVGSGHFIPSDSSGQSAFDRLLGSLRLALRIAPELSQPSANVDEHADLEDDPGEVPPKRVERDYVLEGLEQAWEIFAARVPLDPRSELLRMADVTAHVMLRRHAGRDRISKYVNRWIQLAGAHLRVTDAKDELDQTLIALIVFAGFLDGSPSRARRRLLHVLQGQLSVADAAALQSADWRLTPTAVLIQSIAGPEGLEATWLEVQRGDTAYDELLAIGAAVRGEAAFPVLKHLKDEPEAQQAESLIARGRVDRIFLLSAATTSCPKDHRVLPTMQQHRLRGRGLATAECCGCILINLYP